MKHLSIFAAMLALVLGAEEINFTFKGKGGKNLTPKVEKLTEGSRTYYRCTPVEKEPWQALQIVPDKPVDLSKYRAISFEFRQKFYGADDPAVCCYISCPGGAVYTDFAGGNRKNWKRWKSLLTPVSGKVQKKSVSPRQIRSPFIPIRIWIARKNLWKFPTSVFFRNLRITPPARSQFAVTKSTLSPPTVRIPPMH